MTKIKIRGGNSHAFAQARKKIGKSRLRGGAALHYLRADIPANERFFHNPPAAKTCYKITMATIYIEVILLLMVAVISFIHDP